MLKTPKTVVSSSLKMLSVLDEAYSIMLNIALSGASPVSVSKMELNYVIAHAEAVFSKSTL